MYNVKFTRITAGRIRKGPAPLNLEIPEYEVNDAEGCTLDCAMLAVTVAEYEAVRYVHHFVDNGAVMQSIFQGKTGAAQGPRHLPQQLSQLC